MRKFYFSQMYSLFKSSGDTHHLPGLVHHVLQLHTRRYAGCGTQARIWKTKPSNMVRPEDYGILLFKHFKIFSGPGQNKPTTHIGFLTATAVGCEKLTLIKSNKTGIFR